jgi:hypothetical protein
MSQTPLTIEDQEAAAPLLAPTADELSSTPVYPLIHSVRRDIIVSRPSFLFVRVNAALGGGPSPASSSALACHARAVCESSEVLMSGKRRLSFLRYLL